ncbi:MAG: hypothetical protein JNJ99_11830 [Crocinitomicaceae bacterium]|nr:hypothetical protein [Crocinitomicaceae bacterium]
MKKFLKITRKILFWVFFISLFLLTTVTVLLHIYEDDIKQYAIDEINDHLKTDLEVQSIELSLFHDFPRASLEFRKVLIRDAFESRESTDTLLFAEKSFLTFNIWDIWNEDYSVKRLAFEDAKLNLRTAKDGDVNYDIFKETADSSESNFEFVLELLRIDRLAFQYINQATGQQYKIDVLKSLIKADFTAENFEIVSESDVYIRKLKSNALTLIRNKPAHLDLNLIVNTLAQSYQFTRGDILIGKMPFELNGFVDSSSIDLAISGKNIELSDLANSLAAGTMPDAPRYQGTGILDFNAIVKGPTSSTEMPSVVATFNLDNGTLTNPSNNLKIHDLTLNGEYRNAQSDRDEQLSFSAFDLKLLNSYFSGKGTVKNFSQPEINALMKGNLDLGAFHRFFRMPNVQRVGGQVDLDMELAVKFLDPQYQKEKFSISKSRGNLNLKNVFYKHVQDSIAYEKINGQVVINDNDAAVKDFEVRTEKSDLVLNGALNNLLQYLAGYGGLGVIASLESEHIDLNEFIGESNAKEDETPEKFILPENLSLNVDMNVGELVWDDHRFSEVGGKLLLVNRKATASDFSLKTLDGNVKGSLVLNNLVEAGNVIEGKFSFDKVNVKTLFSEWKNFDQTTITDQHLSGVGSGTVDLLLFFNPYFSLIQEKMYALSDVTIKNGELKDMETMRMTTDYMRSNKALKVMLNKHIDKFEEKLMHLKFATLSNKIEIKDRKIFIPEMTISTNALDVNLFGWHDFDNNVEYHFSFRFRDLKTVAEYTEFGKVEDDGLGIIIYLTMSGPIDNPEFALDGDERKNDLKENLAQEKQDLKSMLKTEFGLFKNDSTVQVIDDKNKKQVEFIFYDEDIEVQDSAKVKEKNKTRTNKLFEKIEKEKENEEKEEVEFGEDE